MIIVFYFCVPADGYYNYEALQAILYTSYIFCGLAGFVLLIYYTKKVFVFIYILMIIMIIIGAVIDNVALLTTFGCAAGVIAMIPIIHCSYTNLNAWRHNTHQWCVEKKTGEN